ncbi:MAG: hypothetical protein E2O85_04585 [Bacteroidetes bacterium]|nr:MAG: hypothetical protein E2O85_04585 [Bacteroidota bacterium]
MKSLFNKQIRVGVLLTAVFLLFAALVVFAESTSDATHSDYWDDTSTEWDYEAYDTWRNKIHSINSKRVQISSEAIGKQVKSAMEVEKLKPSKDLQSANGLAMELRRIVRAGRSMESLRNTQNQALRRRCYDGMRKLQAQAIAIKTRRKNLAVPTRSLSLEKVFSNILKCVSCAGNANQACNLAQKDLDLIVRSLSMD